MDMNDGEDGEAINDSEDTTAEVLLARCPRKLFRLLIYNVALSVDPSAWAAKGY